MNSKLWGWQILFLIEGAFTIAFSILVAVMLPWSLSSASFLPKREKEVGRLRVLKDGSERTETKIQLKRFFKPLSDWKFYVFSIIGEVSLPCRIGFTLRYLILIMPHSNLLWYYSLCCFELPHSNNWSVSLLCCKDKPIHGGALCLWNYRTSPHRLVFGSLS